MKRLLFAFALLFLCSTLGARLSYKAPKQAEATILVRAEQLDNALKDALEDIVISDSTEASLSGTPVLTETAFCEASRLFYIENGTPVYFDSSLLSDLTLLLRTSATLRDGVPYLGETLLSVGGRYTLASQFFCIEVRVISVKVGGMG